MNNVAWVMTATVTLGKSVNKDKAMVRIVLVVTATMWCDVLNKKGVVAGLGKRG